MHILLYTELYFLDFMVSGNHWYVGVSKIGECNLKSNYNRNVLTKTQELRDHCLLVYNDND